MRWSHLHQIDWKRFIPNSLAPSDTILATDMSRLKILLLALRFDSAMGALRGDFSRHKKLKDNLDKGRLNMGISFCGYKKVNPQ